jgi:hypothetical protein
VRWPRTSKRLLRINFLGSMARPSGNTAHSSMKSDTQNGGHLEGDGRDEAERDGG